MSTSVRRRRTLRSRLLAHITGGIDRLRNAWTVLAGAQDRLLNTLGTIPTNRNGINRRLRAAIAAFNAALSAFNRMAGAFAERWAATDLPLIYLEGAHSMLDNADRPHALFQWTSSHRAAITTASAQYFADFTGRIQEAIRRARVFLRAATDAARDTSSRRIDTDRLRRDHPLNTVVYANNARHPVDAWARAAITWQAVTTANTAAARTAYEELGVDFVEVRDGEDCGWLSHNDPDRANRTLRTVQDALAHPAAHPHCQREFLPRLDLVGRSEIRGGALL